MLCGFSLLIEESSGTFSEMHSLVLGKEHPSTLTSMNNLSEALTDQGKYVEAKEML